MPLTIPGDHSRLALHGGPPSISESSPAWPLADPDVEAALAEVYASGDWGRYHGSRGAKLADHIGEMHGTEFVHLVCSGTYSVELALRSVGVSAGDEVILAAYDFPGNFRAIEAIGARPVLVDLAADSWSLDPDLLPLAVSDSTTAILVSHLHGTLARMNEIVEFAQARGIRVVEDACQSPGAIVDGKPAGTWGDVGVLSFGGSKLLTAGRGGALLTPHEDVWQRAKIIVERGNHAFPLSELQAAVLLPQLAKLHERNKIRRHGVQRLLSRLGQVTGLSATRAAAFLTDAAASLTEASEHTTVSGKDSWHTFAAYYKLGLQLDPSQITVATREQFVAAAHAEGVSLDAGFRGFTKRTERRCRRAGDLPQATQAMETTLLLHHPALLQSADYIDRVADALIKISECFRRR